MEEDESYLQEIVVCRLAVMLGNKLALAMADGRQYKVKVHGWFTSKFEETELWMYSYSQIAMVADVFLEDFNKAFIGDHVDFRAALPETSLLYKIVKPSDDEDFTEYAFLRRPAGWMRVVKPTRA